MTFRHFISLISTLMACSIIEIVLCLSHSEKDEILTRHNNFRIKMVKFKPRNNIANMQEMVWDDKLEKSAKENLQKLEQMNWDFQAVDFDWTSINIGTSMAGPKPIANIVNEWYKGNRHFSYKKKACPPKKYCTSFLNIVNPMHSKLGCFDAITKHTMNRTGYTLLCQYSRTQPEIHYHLEFVYGKPCSDCDETRPFCRNDLCSKCTIGENNCSCQVTCAKNKYGEGVLDGDACRCNCTYGTGANCDRECKDIKDWKSNPKVCRQAIKPCMKINLLIQHYKTLCPLKCGFCKPTPKKRKEKKGKSPDLATL